MLVLAAQSREIAFAPAHKYAVWLQPSERVEGDPDRDIPHNKRFESMPEPDAFFGLTEDFGGKAHVDASLDNQLVEIVPSEYLNNHFSAYGHFKALD